MHNCAIPLQDDMDTRQTTSEEDDLETSSNGSSSQNSATRIKSAIRQSDMPAATNIVISKNVSVSSGSARRGSSESHQILISSSSSINVQGESARARARAGSVLQREEPPSVVGENAAEAPEVLRPPPRLKKLAKMRQAEQMQRTRNAKKNFCPKFS